MNNNTIINKVLRVREAIRKPFEDTDLSPQEREVMYLALQDKSDLDIAMTLDVSIGTVKSALFRARGKLGIERSGIGWWVVQRIERALDGAE